MVVLRLLQKMTARRASCLTSLVWAGLILASAVSWMRPSPTRNFTLAEFEESDFSEWISLPGKSTEIVASFHGGFDTNYRTVRFAHDHPDPQEIARRSILRNPQHHGEEVLWLENRMFSLEGVFEIFFGADASAPSWWVRPMAGTVPIATVAYWERNGYGYGYLIVAEPEIHRVRILQFSQQHLKFEAIQRAFPHPAG